MWLTLYFSQTLQFHTPSTPSSEGIEIRKAALYGGILQNVRFVKINCYSTLKKNKEVETQRGELICPKSHRLNKTKDT